MSWLLPLGSGMCLHFWVLLLQGFVPGQCGPLLTLPFEIWNLMYRAHCTDYSASDGIDEAHREGCLHVALWVHQDEQDQWQRPPLKLPKGATLEEAKHIVEVMLALRCDTGTH